MEENIIRVGTGRIEITDNPKKHLLVTGLDSCVGVGIINSQNNNIRGAGHLLYVGDVFYVGGRESYETTLASYDKNYADKFLEQLLTLTFISSPEKSKAFAVANLFKHDFKGTPINPMLDYVIEYFAARHIKTLFDTESVYMDRPIFWKGLALHERSADVLYYSNIIQKINGNYVDTLIGSKHLR